LKYDYGEKGNLQRYGTAEPPTFHLHNIDQVPIGMFVGKKDVLAVPADTRWEAEKMKSVVFYKEYEDTDHSSFALGKQAHTYLDDLIILLKKYNN